MKNIQKYNDNGNENAKPNKLNISIYQHNYENKK